VISDAQALVAACHIKDRLIEMTGAGSLPIARSVVRMVTDRVLDFQRRVIDTVGGYVFVAKCIGLMADRL